MNKYVIPGFLYLNKYLIFMTEAMIDFPIFKFLAHFHSLEKNKKKSIHEFANKKNVRNTVAIYCDDKIHLLTRFLLFVFMMSGRWFYTRIFSLFHFSRSFLKKRIEVQTEILKKLQVLCK